MTKYGWIGGAPVVSDETNFEWVAGAPRIVYEHVAVTASGATRARVSAAGLLRFKKVIIPDGVMTKRDRKQVACLYSGLEDTDFTPRIIGII